MNFLNTYPAVVKNNKDPLKKGRVQIKVYHLHETLEDSALPWAYPMTDINGGDSEYGSSFIPETGSKIWVVFENIELQEPIFYISAFMWDDDSNKIFSTFYNTDKSKIGISSSYPDVKFIKLKNGITLGISSNSATPEIFIYHTSGSSLVFDKSGDITIKDKSNKVSIIVSDGEIQINAKKGSTIRSKGDWRHNGDFYAAGEIVARSQSDGISLGSHVHPTAVPGSPSMPTKQSPISDTATSNKKTDFGTNASMEVDAFDTSVVDPDIGLFSPQIAVDPDTIDPDTGFGLQDEEALENLVRNEGISG
jgi:hypothetical protein